MVTRTNEDVGETPRGGNTSGFDDSKNFFEFFDGRSHNFDARTKKIKTSRQEIRFHFIEANNKDGKFKRYSNFVGGDTPHNK